jgi:hypothetical protein
MTDGSSYTIYSRIPFDFHPADKSDSKLNRGGYPLMTRAWVYQERLLAPRVLYFGEELSWECREASTCECSEASHGIKHNHSLSLLPGSSTGKLHLQWQRMVEEFTWLQLSHEEDRLPAFSGLAQQYQHRLKSAYLAGLWQGNLSADLMWFAYPESGSEAQRYYTKKPKKWRAPSWSWASVEGPILFSKDYHIGTFEADSDSVTSWIDIISAKCTPSSLDPTETVGRGHLTIKGSGQLARLKHTESCVEHGTRHFSVKHFSADHLSIHSNFSVDGQEAYVDYDLIEHGLMEANSDMSVYRLYLGGMSLTARVFRLNRGDFVLRPEYWTWSLLLRCVDGQFFERVGLVVSRHDNGSETQSRNGLEDCTITIV